jgi:hypothetical protein
MNIKDQWDRLDSTTQQWFIDNPGCVILPRTVSAVVNSETGSDDATDQHGERLLSQEELEFIRSKAKEASTDG